MDIMSFLLGYESGKSAGKKWIFASGTFTPTASKYTFAHNLGVIPDMIMVWARKTPAEAGKIIFCTGFSDAVMNNAGNPQVAFCATLVRAQIPGSDPPEYHLVGTTWKNAVSFTNPGASGVGYLHNVTATEASIGSASVCTMDTTVEYEWLAIGGIF